MRPAYFAHPIYTYTLPMAETFTSHEAVIYGGKIGTLNSDGTGYVHKDTDDAFEISEETGKRLNIDPALWGTGGAKAKAPKSPTSAPKAPTSTPKADDDTDDDEDSTPIPSDFPHAELLKANAITSFEALRATENADDLQGIGEAKWREVQAALALL